MATPNHPPHLLWALWTDNDTGEIVLTNQQGEVFHLPPAEPPHLAAMLADHCDDNDERWHVRDSWSELEPDDDEPVATDVPPPTESCPECDGQGFDPDRDAEGDDDTCLACGGFGR